MEHLLLVDGEGCNQNHFTSRYFGTTATFIHALSGRYGVGTPKRNDFDFTLLVALLHNNMEPF